MINFIQKSEVLKKALIKKITTDGAFLPESIDCEKRYMVLKLKRPIELEVRSNTLDVKVVIRFGSIVFDSKLNIVTFPYTNHDSDNNSYINVPFKDISIDFEKLLAVCENLGVTHNDVEFDTVILKDDIK
jgi:hypothetical protein